MIEQRLPYKHQVFFLYKLKCHFPLVAVILEIFQGATYPGEKEHHPLKSAGWWGICWFPGRCIQHFAPWTLSNGRRRRWPCLFVAALFLAGVGSTEGGAAAAGGGGGTAASPFNTSCIFRRTHQIPGIPKKKTHKKN